MKTILDAVNTLKGVWPSESIQIIEIDGVEFSEKEFNAQVKGCSNNFGLPSVTAIDWSNAPKGATHYYPAVNCFYDFTNKNEGFVFNGEKEDCSDFECFGECLIPRPKETFKPLDFGFIPDTKPIYTKAMFDHGELPCVGMECKIFYNEMDSRFNDFYDCIIEVIAITGDVFTFKNDLYGFGALKLKLKMLEVIRSDKEKAVAELHAEYPYKTAGQLLSLAYDKWVK